MQSHVSEKLILLWINQEIDYILVHQIDLFVLIVVNMFLLRFLIFIVGFYFVLHSHHCFTLFFLKHVI